MNFSVSNNFQENVAVEQTGRDVQWHVVQGCGDALVIASVSVTMELWALDVKD